MLPSRSWYNPKAYYIHAHMSRCLWIFHVYIVHSIVFICIISSLYTYWHIVSILLVHVERFNCPLRHCGFPRHHRCWAEILNHLGWWTTLLPPGQMGQSCQERASVYSERYDEMICIVLSYLHFYFCTCIDTFSMYLCTTPTFDAIILYLNVCIYIYRTCVLRNGAVWLIFSSRSRDSQQSTASAKAAKAWWRILKGEVWGGLELFEQWVFFFLKGLSYTSEFSRCFGSRILFKKGSLDLNWNSTLSKETWNF